MVCFFNLEKRCRCRYAAGGGCALASRPVVALRLRDGRRWSAGSDGTALALAQPDINKGYGPAINGLLESWLPAGSRSCETSFIIFFIGVSMTDLNTVEVAAASGVLDIHDGVGEGIRAYSRRACSIPPLHRRVSKALCPPPATACIDPAVI